MEIIGLFNMNNDTQPYMRKTRKLLTWQTVIDEICMAFSEHFLSRLLNGTVSVSIYLMVNKTDCVGIHWSMNLCN